MLIVVEGTTDIEFLTRISATLSAANPQLPNLSDLAVDGTVVFLPFGGGNVAAWHDRLRPLRLAEYHLYDGESPPETAVRQHAAARVNARLNCRAAVTAKRSLENYLHPAAIAAAGGPAVCFDATDNVGQIVAEAHHRQHYPTPWESLPRRQRRALVHKAKRWLCTVAVNRMAAELVVEADAAGEIDSWLNSIRKLMA